MFTRAAPRVASRIGSHAQCEAHPHIHAFPKLPSRTWRPLQQQMARRHNVTFAQQAKEQYRRSPIMFPFAIGVYAPSSAAYSQS
jgi:hypothetical protein